MRTVTKVGFAEVMGIAVLVGSESSAPAYHPAAKVPTVSGVAALVAFDSCAGALRGFQQQAAPFVTPYGLSTATSGYLIPDVAQFPTRGTATPLASQPAQGQAAASAAPEHSDTNVHEPGVDEPDVVKTDGKRLITVVDGRLRVVDLASQRVTGTLDLPGSSAAQLLLQGDRALVVVPQFAAVSGSRAPIPATAPGSQLMLVDLVSAPRVLGTLTVDGAYLDARQIDGVASIVIRSQPRLSFVYPDHNRSVDAALRENQRVVAESSIADWLPHYELDQDGTRQQGQLVDCDQVRACWQRV